MISVQQECKSRWRGRYWTTVELKLVEGAVILDGGSPKALVRLGDESCDVVRVEIADLAAYEAARRACVLPKTETLRLRGAGLFEALDAHWRRRVVVLPPKPPALQPLAEPEPGSPLPPAPGVEVSDAVSTVGALEARLKKLQTSDLERRLAALNPVTASAAPPVEALRARLAALRDGDATGPAFVDRPKCFMDATYDDANGIVARAREAARLDGRVCSDDGLLECLAGLDDDAPGPAATADDVESLLREARHLGVVAREDLAGAESKRDDVADLLSRAGDLVARAAQDRGGGSEPSTDLPDYDDDSANDEPTDSSSEDDGDSDRQDCGRFGGK